MERVSYRQLIRSLNLDIDSITENLKTLEAEFGELTEEESMRANLVERKRLAKNLNAAILWQDKLKSKIKNKF